MKVKMKKVDDELRIEYYQTKDLQQFRFGVLECFMNSQKENAVILVDTNNGTKKISISALKELLEELSIPYLIEETSKTERKVLGFSFTGTSKRAKENSKENLIIMMIDKGQLMKKLYDEFLQYFDYGAGLDPKLEILEIMGKYRNDSADVLFNDGVLPVCLYDSIVISHIRIKPNDIEIEKNIQALIQ